MQLFDSHCHIHEADIRAVPGDNSLHNKWLQAGKTDPNALIADAEANDVVGMICVGTTLADSSLAVEFVRSHPQCWASVGVHPHEASRGEVELKGLTDLLTDIPSRPVLDSIPWSQDTGSSGLTGNPVKDEFITTRFPIESGMTPRRRDDKIVAIGECGLDYYYNHSPKQDQEKALRSQIELAVEHDLPLIFHVRDAYQDFWPIFDSYPNLRGVLHSFTDTQANLDKALERGLYIGLNGIITFTKHPWQLDVAKAVPLERLLLETDAPFLTPHPYRGTINEPAYTKSIAEFIANLKQVSLEILGPATTENTRKLFSL